jgi:hypothetical protein
LTHDGFRRSLFWRFSKRGDILKANVGDDCERIFLALRIRRLKSIDAGRGISYSSGVDGISNPSCIWALVLARIRAEGYLVHPLPSEENTNCRTAHQTRRLPKAGQDIRCAVCVQKALISMTIGTKSVLFGAHQFILHPIALTVAWTMLYGLPLDPRLLVAFIVHDWGYVGKNNMDGDEGESHPILGAAIMRLFFGKAWGDFSLYHSRFYARRRKRLYSRLAIADKLAVSIMPAWLYIPLVSLTGEIHEYMGHTAQKEASLGAFRNRGAEERNVRLWYSELRISLRQWAEENKHVPGPISAN